MKKTRRYCIGFLASVFFLCLFVACNGEENSIDPTPTLTLIKFSNPVYKEYVMVTTDRDCGSLWGVRRYDSTPSDSFADLYGKYPYCDLTDNWLLLDWKWDGMYYQDMDAIVHQKWTENPYPFASAWPDSALYVCRPVAEVYYVDLVSAVTYKGDTIKHPIWRTPFFDRHQLSDSATYERDLQKMYYIDSAYTDLVPVLNQMIVNDELHKYGKHYKSQTIE